MSEARYTKEQTSNLAVDVLEFYSNRQYPVKVLSIAHNLGLQVFKTTFSRDGVSGSLKDIIVFLFAIAYFL